MSTKLKIAFFLFFIGVTLVLLIELPNLFGIAWTKNLSELTGLSWSAFNPNTQFLFNLLAKSNFQNLFCWALMNYFILFFGFKYKLRWSKWALFIPSFGSQILAIALIAREPALFEHMKSNLMLYSLVAVIFVIALVLSGELGKENKVGRDDNPSD